MGTDPKRSDAPLAVSLAAWNDARSRLSWPAQAGVRYEILGSSDPSVPAQPIATVPGVFPECEWFAPLADVAARFYRVRRAAP
jgi:hypothetical protein